MRMLQIAFVPLLTLLLAAGALAQAQVGQPAGQGDGAPGASAPPALPATPEDLTTQGATIVRRGATISQNVRGMLEGARKEADIIKITCLDNKLTQINANLRNAERRLASLKQAVDSGLRAHEYTVLTVLGQKLQVLDQEAHQCVGQAMYETGETNVVTEIDTDKLPFEEDPSNPPVILPPSLSTLPPPATGDQ